MYTKPVKIATGADSWVMALVWLCLLMAANGVFAPWFSVPELAYRGFTHQFTLWTVRESATLAQGLYGVVDPTQLDWDRMSWLLVQATQVVAGLSCVGLVLSAGAAFRWKGKATTLVRLAAGLSLVSVVGAVAIWFDLSGSLNAAMAQSNTFWNLTMFGHIQLTGFACGQGVVAGVLLVGAGRMLDTQRVVHAETAPKALGRRTRVAAGIILVVVPLLIAFGIVFFQGRSYYFIALCVIGAAMLPFFAAFEDRKPQAREMVLIAALVVIATAGRGIFFMLPHFKPVTALVIVAGIGLGAEAGFLTGALTGFVSNFLFGQGPWTPWQMFAFGIIGFLAGLIFEKRARKGEVSLVPVVVFGFVATVGIYGLLLDTSTALSLLENLTWSSALACYVAGVPVNITHGVSTVLFLLVVTRPMLRKISRIRKKYGLLPGA